MNDTTEISPQSGFLESLIKQLQKEGVTLALVATANVHHKAIEEIAHAIAKTIQPSAHSRSEIPLHASITALPLSTRTQNILWRRHIHTVAELLLVSKDYLTDLRGLGKKSIEDVIGYLQRYGWSLYDANDPYRSAEAFEAVYGSLSDIPINFVRTSPVQNVSIKRRRRGEFYTLGDIAKANWTKFKKSEHRLNEEELRHLKKLFQTLIVNY